MHRAPNCREVYHDICISFWTNAVVWKRHAHIRSLTLSCSRRGTLYHCGVPWRGTLLPPQWLILYSHRPVRIQDNQDFDDIKNMLQQNKNMKSVNGELYLKNVYTKMINIYRSSNENRNWKFILNWKTNVFASRIFVDNSVPKDMNTRTEVPNRTNK